jgi:hypothetical protein
MCRLHRPGPSPSHIRSLSAKWRSGRQHSVDPCLVRGDLYREAAGQLAQMHRATPILRRIGPGLVDHNDDPVALLGPDGHRQRWRGVGHEDVELVAAIEAST